MGTNFYFLFKDKQKKDKWFDWGEVCVTDEPDFGYKVHLAKTSYGWKPLFQGYKRINSVALMRKFYEDVNDCQIIDEYGNYYDWPAFQCRVLDFNKDLPDAKDDDECANGGSISHLLYENGRYRHEYWKDAEGYEFTDHEFS